MLTDNTGIILHNRKVSELESVRIGKCQNQKVSEVGKNWILTLSNPPSEMVDWVYMFIYLYILPLQMQFRRASRSRSFVVDFSVVFW